MDWPDRLKVGPIREWPGSLTPPTQRTVSKFKAGLSSTLVVLDREIWNLCDTDEQISSARLLIAVPANQMRLDGRPYANAKPEHPGVIFSIDSKHGALSYPCDTFTTWQDNLRAIALALEALRTVDRYGVTKGGKQYRGFLEIEASAQPAGFATGDAALVFLLDVADLHGENVDVVQALRMAQRKTHPDRGGNPAIFQQVSLAEAKLRTEGIL